jgi:crotonobetainyl-CoA:carnitine CoA-transferase CaiB-like acyl-CoA transferase
VLIENFRPGAMEGWGLGPDELMAANPRLIVLRISGYGQTGPYRDKPGFGVVAEAMGGLRHLTGEPGRVPVRVGISIGDTLAALHGVIGILLALHERHRSGRGQVIDVALVRGGLQLHGKPAARVQRLRRGARPGRQRPARHRAEQRLPPAPTAAMP